MIIKRILAYLIDYALILLYALILFGVTMTIHRLYNMPLAPLHPLKGNVISFLTLTLPVFLYFYLAERSRHKATLGKKIMKIAVHSDTRNGIFMRNVLKLMPWEIAHFGMHWMIYYSGKELDAPVWIWMALILPQLIVLLYFVSVLLSKGSRSIYDRIAYTQIVSCN